MKKKTLRGDANTARWLYFAPPQTPFPGGAGRPKFNQLEMITIPFVQTQFGEDRCTQFRVIVVTDSHTNTNRDRTDYNTLRRS